MSIRQLAAALRAKEEVILKRREFIINAGTGALALSASRSAQSQTSGSGNEAKRERICISSWSFHNLFESTRDRKAAAPDKHLDILNFPEMIADRYQVH